MKSTKMSRRPITWWLHFLFCCFHSGISSPDADRISTFLIVGEAANASPDFSRSAFSYRHRRKGGSNDSPEEIDLGTTLVAIKYSGGVIVGADTRTSVGGYVSNKFAYKINPIFEPEDDDTDDDTNDNDVEENDRHDMDLDRVSSGRPPSSSCVLCRSGSAADTQWLAKQAKWRFRARKLERPGYRPSISEVAHYLRYQMRNSNDQGGGDSLQASLICAGYDEGTNGGQIFGITPGGSLWEEDNFCVSGSGSTILLGYLDDALQQTKKSFSSDFTEEEAIALVTKLLRLSIGRDGSSGGLVRLYVVNRNGLEERIVYPFTNTLAASSSGSSATTTSVSGETTYAELKGFATPSPR